MWECDNVGMWELMGIDGNWSFYPLTSIQISPLGYEIHSVWRSCRNSLSLTVRRSLSVLNFIMS